MARVEGVEVVTVGSPLVPVVGAVCQLKNPDGTAATHYDQKTGGAASTADLVTDVFGRVRRADGSRWFYDEGQDYRLTYVGGNPPVAAGERWLAGISGEHVDDTTDVHGMDETAGLDVSREVTTGTAAPVLADLAPHSTYFQLDGNGNVVAEWVRADG